MFHKVLIILSSALTVASAIGVLVTKDIVRACIFLFFSLFGVAGIYASLGADFVAVTQIMVYVGGVVILMLFAVMLTGGPGKESAGSKGYLLIPMMGNKITFGFGIFSGLVLLLTMAKITKSVIASVTISEVEGFASTVERIGSLLVSEHVLAFEISSILLLGALVGAAMIARPRKNV
ncbi:MAG: NADH-quinone oxidoreductase subunit J [Bacteriovoracaceae bacterium]|jgi:NADH-quinone oxidoreductase subunit J|nr:NADH-quinone oxidoreductase subunit J [Bacteriovoracaceae bacterium]